MKLIILTTLIYVGITSTTAQDLSQAYEKVSPGVVVIETEESELIGEAGFKEELSVGGIGTGFLISDKQVVTAAHVIQTAENIKVRFLDGEVIPGKAVSTYKSADVGLIELTWPKKKPTILKFADSDKVKTGQQVFIIGTPLGLEYSFSSGYISGKLESNKMNSPFSKVEYFQTDAAINQGNSGGPMFNVDGEVIGVVSHILTNSGGFEGLGFAATSNVAESLLLGDHVGWSGIDGYVLAGDMARIFNVPQDFAVLVQKVVFLSPMGILGVQGGDYSAVIEGEELLIGGDIILEVNGIQLAPDLEALNKLANSLRESQMNEYLEVTVLRHGKKVVLKKE